jgi:RNA polymerase sigma factor (TIGR02999 family)
LAPRLDRARPFYDTPERLRTNQASVILGRMSEVTRILCGAELGDPKAAAQLLPLVYDELRSLAAARLAAEPSGNTLQPTALVHEAYLRLAGADAAGRWDSRGHFFAAAAEAMRRILIDNARRKRSRKRGGGRQRLPLEDHHLAASTADDDNLLAVDEALAKFAAKDRAKAELVKLRFFAGCTIDQAARALGISAATAERWWSYARAWLHQEINGGDKKSATDEGADRPITH